MPTAVSQHLPAYMTSGDNTLLALHKWLLGFLCCHDIGFEFTAWWLKRPCYWQWQL